MHVPLFYKPKPIFGLDIGRSSVKIAQLKQEPRAIKVVGYGYSQFDTTGIEKGVITKPELLIKTIQPVLKQIAIGKLTTNRVVASVPLAHTYTRVMSVPQMNQKDLADAVKLEAEQYIPVPATDLYIEHRLLNAPSPKAADQVPVLLVAVPKKIIESYTELFDRLGLEVAGIEPNMFSNLRAVNFNLPAKEARIVIDFGAYSSDLAIYDGTVRLASTLPKGGEHITQIIAKALELTPAQAHKLKARYGIGTSRWQTQLASALEPILSDFATAVQKMMHYYHDHTNQKATITEIIVVGGGANMPGLGDFLTHLTGVEVRVCNPWQQLEIKPLQPPHQAETTIYATAVGLALWEYRRD